LGGLGATYAVHSRLIGKPVVDLLLAIIELLSLGVRAEALRVNIDWKYPFFEAGEGVSLAHPKFQIEGDVSHQPFFVSEN